MPLLSRTGSMTSKAFGQNVNSVSYWISGNSATLYPFQGGIVPAIAQDSSGNTYIAGTDATLVNGVLIKYNPFGQILWQKDFANTSITSLAAGGSSVYIGGFSGTLLLAQVSQINQSDGALTYTASISGGTNISAINYESGAGVVWAAGTSGSGSFNLFRLNFSTLASSAVVTNVSPTGGYTDYPGNVSFLSSGNPVVFSNGTVFEYNKTTLALINAIITNVQPDSPAGQKPLTGVVVDLSNNMYVFGNDSATSYPAIQKLNSSFTSQWLAKQSMASYTNAAMLSVAVAQDGSVYSIGSSTAGASRSSWIQQADSSGVGVWRNLIYASSSMAVNNLTLTQTNGKPISLYASGSILNTNGLMYKVPADGTRTKSGVIATVGGVDLYYSASNISNTVTTGTTSSSSSSNSAFGGTTSFATPIASSTATYTNTLTNI